MTSPSVLFVTAFKDIDRKSWDLNTSRTKDTYYTWFNNLAQLPITIVCYTDEKDLPQYHNVTFVPYETQTTFYKYIEQEKSIMESPEYRCLIKMFGSSVHPEHKYPEYTVVNHNKTIFIERTAISYPSYDYYVWIDFGILRNKQNFTRVTLKTLSKLPSDKITHACFIKGMNPKYKKLHFVQRMKSLQEGGIQGNCFIVPRSLTTWYRCEYENMLLSMYEKKYTDDDQIMVYELSLLHPNQFNFIASSKWFSMLDVLFTDINY